MDEPVRAVCGSSAELDADGHTASAKSSQLECRKAEQVRRSEPQHQTELWLSKSHSTPPNGRGGLYQQIAAHMQLKSLLLVALLLGITTVLSTHVHVRRDSFYVFARRSARRSAASSTTNIKPENIAGIPLCARNRSRATSFLLVFMGHCKCQTCGLTRYLLRGCNASMRDLAGSLYMLYLG
jgi:hypothetical protein